MKSLSVSLTVSLCFLWLLTTSVSCEPASNESVIEKLCKAYQEHNEWYYPCGKGCAVVKAGLSALEKIFKLLRLPDDHGFLLNIACQETRYGTVNNTYRDGFYGGVWQIDQASWEVTKDVKSRPKLTPLLERYSELGTELGEKDDPYHIRNNSGPWNESQWEMGVYVGYSALATRFFIYTWPDDIPEDLEGQAKLWKKHYHSGNASEEEFINNVKNVCPKLCA